MGRGGIFYYFDIDTLDRTRCHADGATGTDFCIDIQKTPVPAEEHLLQWHIDLVGILNRDRFSKEVAERDRQSFKDRRCGRGYVFKIIHLTV